jgi:hypothetical protein
MGKKKRYRGHYCWVCSSILPNEKFSGSGHKNHICKQCAKKSPEERREIKVVNNIAKISVLEDFSKNNRAMLQSYLNDKSEKIRVEARFALDKYNELMIERRLQRKLEEEYEEKMGIDPWDDEFWEEDDEEIEMSLQDLDKLDGNDNNECWLEDEDNDELPF